RNRPDTCRAFRGQYVDVEGLDVFTHVIAECTDDPVLPGFRKGVDAHQLKSRRAVSKVPLALERQSCRLQICDNSKCDALTSPDHSRAADTLKPNLPRIVIEQVE